MQEKETKLVSNNVTYMFFTRYRFIDSIKELFILSVMYKFSRNMLITPTAHDVPRSKASGVNSGCIINTEICSRMN